MIIYQTITSHHQSQPVPTQLKYFFLGFYFKVQFLLLLKINFWIMFKSKYCLIY